MNRDDYHLIGSNFGRQDETLVVAMDHDDGADDARRKPPGGCPAMLELAALIEVANFKRLCKVLAKKMRRAELQGLPVPHHGFQGIGGVSASELLRIGLPAGDYRDGGVVDGEIGVDVEHLARFGFGLLAGGVRGVAFLPEKFERAEEEFGAQLPADDAVPLIHQDGEVAVGLNPLGPHVADDGFGGWAYDEWFGELFTAADGNYGELRRETLNVMFFFVDEAARDQERKGYVLVTGGLEATVQGLLDVFPERPAVGTHDHAAAHGRVV